MTATRRPIMVMAGGTGGHVFPALAVADCLRQKGEQIVWIGTHSGIESRLVPGAGYPIEWLSVSGLRGKGAGTLLTAPFKLLAACWQAARILRRYRPRVVLGMGGFVAGPGGLMAWLLRIPLVIHEQNAIPGLTNRLLKPLARIAFFAFPQAASGSHVAVVGNPVRAEIVGIEDPRDRLTGRDQQPLRLLVVGGSLGARTLNQTVPAALALIEPGQRPEVRHQCGERNLEHCRQSYTNNGVEAAVSAFIDDMREAYSWADLVVCRAGALTISELAAAGMASILVPFPYAVDDHQAANADFLVSADAAIMLRDQQLTPQILAQHVQALSSERGRVLRMSMQARSVAYVDATVKVANGVLQEALS